MPMALRGNSHVKYTSASGLPDWEGSISGIVQGSSLVPTTQIPNLQYAEEIKLGSNVTGIDNYAFYGCSNLRKVEVPSTITEIGSYVFRNSGLASFTIPNGVTNIKLGAFYDCGNLQSLIIPPSVTTIGNTVFRSCGLQGDFTIPDSVTSLGNSVFFYCEDLTSVTIGSQVTYIGTSLFRNCVGLTSLAFPAGVTKIGNYAFRGCTSLATYDFRRASSVPELVSTAAFQDTPSSMEIIVPDNLYDSWIAADGWSVEAEYIVKASQSSLGPLA